MNRKGDDFPRVEVDSRAALRAWLEAHHTHTGGIWLATGKKSAADRCLPTTFKGHMGVNVFGPSDAQRPEFHIVVKFDSHAHLQRWLDSDVRRSWLASTSADQASPPALEKLAGLETWFALPGRSGPALPPRWKVCIAS